jgi:predicted dienelactone hydrolase
MKVTVWTPENVATGKYPLVIFSHGFHGCAPQGRYLMQAFADDGYWVFAPHHKDSTCNGGKGHFWESPDVSFSDAGSWSETTHKDRHDDIVKLINFLHADDRFRDHLDWTRFGLAGYSLGGYTVLALGGAWPQWKIPDVKAILGLSPYCEPFSAQGTLSGISAPVMYQGGTWDAGITPTLNGDRGCYDNSPQPKYYVEFDRAGHFAWTDLLEKFHADIIKYSLAFMDQHVKGEPRSALLDDPMPSVTRLRTLSNDRNVDTSYQQKRNK